MTPRPHEYHFLLLAALVVGWGGCGPLDPARQAAFEPLILAGADAGPRVVVYGDLSTLLPGSGEATPWLERFLYGPRDAGAGRLRNPQGLAPLTGGLPVPQRLLFVCDQGLPDVVAIDLISGQFRRWTRFDDRPSCPVDVAVDDAGRVYVADTTRLAVLVYDPNGRLLRELAPEPDEGGAFRPTSVLWNDGVLYIGDSGVGCVERFATVDDTWLAPMSPPGDRRGVVAPTGLGMTPDGVLLIADAVQGMVHRVDVEGRWLDPVGRWGRGPGQFIRPKHVCCTSSGYVLVTDAARQSVAMFDSGGTFVTEIGAVDAAGKRLTLPAGLAVCPPDVSAIAEAAAASLAGPSAEYVIISDTLGGVSLTLIGIGKAVGEEDSHGA